MKNKFIITIVSIFVVLSIVFYVLNMYASAYKFLVLETGNIIMLTLCLGAFLIVRRHLGKTPAAFVRGVTGASFLRLMVCMIAVLVYVMLNRQNIHKPTVFVLMGIYALYTAADTVLLSKLAREDK